MISQSRYINIVSGVGAGASVGQRQLILRLVTQNSILPPGIVMEFTTPASVSSYFGSNSEESNRAVAYFAFVSKIITAPAKISFTRWIAAAQGPTIAGDATAKVLTTFTAITSGSLSFIYNSGSSPVVVSSINLSTATSLTNVASLLQTALRLNANSQLTGCTVTYNTNTNQFVLQGGVSNTDTLVCITNAVTSNTDLGPLLGLSTSGAVATPGFASAQSAVTAISNSAQISNNFGAFAFVGQVPGVSGNSGGTVGGILQLAQADMQAVATWNTSQNLLYMYCIPATIATASAIYTAVATQTGCAITLVNTAIGNDYAEQCPAEILAATNYNRVNATQNYMYNQFPTRNIVVSDDNVANSMDTVRANYIGVTQSAGAPLAFYQRGVLTGTGTAPLDMNVYANEQWLKSDIAYRILSGFLGLPEIPVNNTGRAMVISLIQGSVSQALLNGVISAGKTLTNVQQQYISTITGDANAWRQVSTTGYWLDVQFSSQTGLGGNTEWTANYVLVYSKKDDVRVVTGSDILI